MPPDLFPEFKPIPGLSAWLATQEIVLAAKATRAQLQGARPRASRPASPARSVSRAPAQDSDTPAPPARRPHVARSTGNVEWYTPPDLVEAARDTLGGIDVDPASCAEANKVVKATRYFTAQDDGLSQPWSGRCWLNPPFARGLVEPFADKLLASLDAGSVSAAITLTNNATETGWFQRLFARASAACFPEKRVRFWSPRGEAKTPLQGQVLLYFGPRPDLFAARFKVFGRVVPVGTPAARDHETPRPSPRVTAARVGDASFEDRVARILANALLAELARSMSDCPPEREDP
jgi:ParB family chromosome partitioning protein